MYCTRKINADYTWVGADCRRLALFEGVFGVPDGVSFNSYLLTDEKTVLFDTVDNAVRTTFRENVTHALAGRTPDYLVVHHMEPDHAVEMADMARLYPDMTILCSAAAKNMIAQFFDAELAARVTVVKEGDTLCTGKHTLRFIAAPMVHWPEVLMTYDETDKLLLTADAFGSFGALNGSLFADEVDFDRDVLDEARRYYANIVGKYGTPVQSALKKLAGVKLDYICSTHGPVWHEYIEKVIGMYDSMSKYETEPGLVICYGTMYGNTERAAEVIARAASEAGVKNIVMYNVSKTHHSYIIRDVFRYNALIVGAPTYNTGLYHEMDVLLAELANKDIKNHKLGWFGSYGWASKAVGKIKEWNDTRLHFEAVGEPVDICQSLNDETFKQCEELGRKMAEVILKN